MNLLSPSDWCLLKFIFKNKRKLSVAIPTEEWLLNNNHWLFGSCRLGFAGAETRHCGHNSFIGSPGARAASTVQNTHIGRHSSIFLQPGMLVRVCHPLSSAERWEFTILFSGRSACRMPYGPSPQPFTEWRCRANVSAEGFQSLLVSARMATIEVHFVYFSPQQVLSMIINAAYKPGRVLRELQLVEDPHWNFQEETLKAK